MKEINLMYDELEEVFVLMGFDEEDNIVCLEEFEGTTPIIEVNKFVTEVYGCRKLGLILADFPQCFLEN